MKVVMGKKLYSVNETAELLGVSHTSVHNYSKQGLKVTHIGGRKLFAEGDIKDFLEKGGI